MKTGDYYSLSRLIITGLLLGSGTNFGKARLLFEVFDVEGTHKLSIDSILKLCREVFEIAVTCLTSLADLTRPDVSNHVNMLINCRGEAEAMLKGKILGEELEITLDDFVGVFAKGDLSQFCTSWGARRFFLKAFNEKHPPFLLKNLGEKKPVFIKGAASMFKAHLSKNTDKSMEEKKSA
jgi:hypothetical protein